MLDLLIVAYVQCILMLIQLQKVLGEELKCLFSNSFIGMNHTKDCGCESLMFLLHEE
jgi:hypothetical protein